MDSKYKIGIGIITCDRPDYLNNLLSSINKDDPNIYEFIIIDDGLVPIVQPDYVVYKTEGKIGVGKAKNIALKRLVHIKCDYIFIIEDDMIIKDQNIFEQYIKAHIESGIHHFNFGPGSPFNRKQKIQNYDLHNRHELSEESEPKPKLIVDYKSCKIALYEHITGMFSFFTKECLTNVGLIDEDYKNAWEHVDHTNRIINANYHPPFWWFADIANSTDFIDSQKNAIQNSTTSKNTAEWLQNVQNNAEIYRRKNGHYPTHTPQSSQGAVVDVLKRLKTNG
jgi:GT2 family glycosyltransferase